MDKSTPLTKDIANKIKVRKKPPVLIPMGAWLKDEREECFCLLIADGIALAIAYKTAGFKGTDKDNSAHKLFQAPRIQERVTAILRARASSPAVSLPEITDMLKRVYVGAIHSNEFTPAHNAAFSLARLYGLVVDRAQLDVVRRPSREPDAPAEIALSDWVAALPSGPSGAELYAYNSRPVVSRETKSEGSGLVIEGSLCGSDLDANPLNSLSNPQSLGPDGRAGTENGAPTRPVTGTPTPGAFSSPEGDAPSSENGAPSTAMRVPGLARGADAFSALASFEENSKSGPCALPSAEDLFG